MPTPPKKDPFNTGPQSNPDIVPNTYSSHRTSHRFLALFLLGFAIIFIISTITYTAYYYSKPPVITNTIDCLTTNYTSPQDIPTQCLPYLSQSNINHTEEPIHPPINSSIKSYPDPGIFPDPKGNFTFQYPPSLTPRPCMYGTNFYKSGVEVIPSEYCETPPWGNLVLEYSDSPISHGYTDNDAYQITSTNIELDDLPATKAIITQTKDYPGPKTLTTVTFQINYTYYRLMVRSEAISDKELDQILSTFEFTPNQFQPCTQNEDPCDPSSCSYDLKICTVDSTTTIR